MLFPLSVLFPASSVAVRVTLALTNRRLEPGSARATADACVSIPRRSLPLGLGMSLAEGGRHRRAAWPMWSGDGAKVIVEVSGCAHCETFAGEAVVAKDPLPPVYPS